LAAAAERILPGAIEAGVPEYMDYWLARQPFSVAPDWKPILKVGAVHLDRIARADHKRAFADCKPEEQDAVLTRFQQGGIKAKRFNSKAFFQRLVTLTLEGYLSDPKYGGNRDWIGWSFIGRTPCWWAPKRLP
jgi:gluconate 2-dehydrogenase gamma chain